MKITWWVRSVLCAAALLLVSSCNTGPWFDESPLTLRLADGPVDDAFAVVVTVTGFEIIDDSSIYDYEIPLNPPLQVDLLALSDGASVPLVERMSWVADRYDGIRLMVRTDLNAQYSWIDTATGRHALYLPGGNQGGLVTPQALRIPESGEADYTIDFDLRQSILPPVEPGQPYLLAPVVRLVNTFTAGSIWGQVNPDTASAPDCVPAVYAFAGPGVNPDDIDRIPPEPLTEGTVRLDSASGEYRYFLAHLPPGSYTIALTCQAGLDRVDRNDLSALTSTVTFGTPVVVSLGEGQVVRADLP